VSAAWVARHGGIVRAAMACELRRHSAFRVGFLVREVLRGCERPAIMIFVYAAMFRSSGAASFRGWTFEDLVRYMLLVALVEKLLFHERALEVAEQIFDGYLTKHAVLPARYFSLVLGRWLQYTAVQAPVVAGLWLLGALVAPAWWPVPVGPRAVFEALALVLLGSYCSLLLYYLVNLLAFWLDVVWTLIAMARIVVGFARGDMVPVALMPHALRDALTWTFPYWSLSGPIEILLGKDTAPPFAQGVLVLVATAVALQLLCALAWSRGMRCHAGVGA
jgi:ABC-type uncharacterized transport system permease subunit